MIPCRFSPVDGNKKTEKGQEFLKASEAIWKSFEEWTQCFDEASIKRHFTELASIRHYLINTQKSAKKIVEFEATKKVDES